MNTHADGVTLEKPRIAQPAGFIPDLLRRKMTRFVLWRPGRVDPPPCLVIGQFQIGNPPTLASERRLDLRQHADHPDLWELPAADCGLAEDTVYHYWFEVTDNDDTKPVHPRILCTDPTAWAVDWRLLAPRPAGPFGEEDRDPASVVLFRDGRLTPCDPGGDTPAALDKSNLDELAPNHRTVIYELPTAWTRIDSASGSPEIGVGTFRDVRALIEPGSSPANFAGTAALERGHAHLAELGVNALELLPPADSFVNREWGYATSNYFAADFDLGFPAGHASPTATTDLEALVAACHRRGIRFFADMVMAFATRWSYQSINFAEFHVRSGSDDPDEFDQGHRRDAFGGTLFRYNRAVDSYDPIDGTRGSLMPARRIMAAQLARWMLDFRIDGVRMDSVVNFASWDFISEFKNYARRLWLERWVGSEMSDEGLDARFLVVGEELAVPLGLIYEQRLDALWNEVFKRMVRSAIMGRNDESEPSFEWTVRKLIDCRLLGFIDGSQAVNYVTSHDVEGFRNERLFNLLNNNGIPDTAPHIRLAFVCLLTAVGVPMIFAGEEFADQHDLAVVHPSKQRDPVNFDRVQESWRQDLFRFVARLVRFRIASPALSVNDTDFIHVDFDGGKRVVVWRRGRPGIDDPVVVVANFSDFVSGSDGGRPAEYFVPNWPATPAGRSWSEITQERDVPSDWVGREPLFAWEAKVYTLA